VPSQTHVPLVLLHSWPDEQAAHAAPLLPHDAFDSLESATHVPELQQPEQDVPPQEHTPLEQLLPEPHAEHAAPPVPHDELVCELYGTHVLPLQQPFGHEVASQTHVPLVLLHSWPDPQPEQVAPPVPHEVFDCEE
jgi:hypothetical protein